MRAYKERGGYLMGNAEVAELYRHGYSNLAGYTESGLVWREGNDYVGLAQDGTEVIVGSVGDEPNTDRYLAENGPEVW